jgi:DNA/RNA-binding domain of Phe-tRNA-synthetase-like protein
MARRTYSISQDVFALAPGYVRGVVVAYDLQNGASSPELVDQLRAAEADLRKRLDLETLTAHPRIASWRAAFKAQGIKPNEFRCSVEAMVRRALRDQQLPSINALVDIGNVLSLRHVVPVGSHAIDVVTGDLALRPATGAETFLPFGAASEAPEHPVPGEIVFTEGNTVLTRRWSWRQSSHTLTLPGTRAIEFNVDGLPPVTQADVESICLEVIDRIQRHCGGVLRYELLTRDHPTMSIER